ncbi:hypothetical protein [Vibrio brasiliensis]|uniref:Uncharacterized protein n=1 Tax=Vibrio brasiliensis LMG 20546 TaxID=945543 RepID=E8LYQ8_9VIBR|nr:hypothetical protein [Vibrio brasiliensis]EGA64172.1 hypothetical protein VIBR0546_02509 [Vibrio brasiliensis LMG 20546]
MSSPQASFERLISREPMHADFEDLKRLALAVWHEGFTPNVDAVSGYEAQVTCYLLERLIRFNCVNDDRYGEIDDIIKRLEKDLIIPPNSRDDISKSAQKWGLNSDLNVLIRLLLPYQTRHYRPNSDI